MSNMFLNALPETVEVDGKAFFIDTDFRTCMIFEKIIMSDEKPEEKLQEALDLFYPSGQPSDFEAAIHEAIFIYKCGETSIQEKTRAKKNGNVALKPQLIYDYEYDAPYIYAAFLSQYGIDLVDIDYLHWWKFQALFKSLESTTKIMEIMSYRAADIRKIKNKEERARIAKLKELYRIPQHMTYEDKVAMAGAAFAF